MKNYYKNLTLKICLIKSNSQELLISGEFVNEIDIPLINYKSKKTKL